MTMKLRQLKRSEIADARRQFSMKQKYLCPVCGLSIVQGAMLDHCHSTGHVRATLCSTCNRNEGKVLAAMRYMTSKGHPAWANPIGWLRALADYLEYHKDNPSGIIHPSFDVEKGKQRPIKRRKKK